MSEYNANHTEYTSIASILDAVELPEAKTIASIQQHKRIYLTGYMGAGKSTTGKLLANMLHYRFYDTDVLVAKGFQKKIPEIFEDSGELTFRRAEFLVLQKLSRMTHCVIASGGGTLVKQEALNLAKATGVVIYLRAPLPHLYNRIACSAKQRPLIDVPDSKAVFEQTFQSREAYYNQSDLIVDTDQIDLAELIAVLLNKLSTVSAR
ncbi:MAG: shikimate kinase [Cyanobacteria bacterium P01_H01_bin.74]